MDTLATPNGVRYRTSMTTGSALEVATAIPPIEHGVFFSPSQERLPRGRHARERLTTVAAQGERVMTAFTELVAANGLAAVTVADVVARASVSRTAFYTCFDNLAGCADAAYERFISVLVDRLTKVTDPASHWHAFVESAIRTYLETLQSDLVVARAMQLEMDAAGSAARSRCRAALTQLADLVARRHALLREEDPTIGPLPEEAHLGHLYAVRQLACDALEDRPDPDLLRLVDPAVRWVAATVRGAALTSEAELPRPSERSRSDSNVRTDDGTMRA